MAFAIVRISDMLVTEVNSSAQSPDLNHFIEIETSFDFGSTHDHRYNEGDSTFYNVGPKASLVTQETAKVQLSPFSATEGFFFRGEGFSGTATKSSDGTPLATVIDWHVPLERWVNGTHVILNNHSYGDNYDVEVVDKNYTYAGVLYGAEYAPGVPWSVATPNGVPLEKFISNWTVDANHPQKPIKADYPARIYADLYIRVTYRAVGTANDVNIFMNGLLHEKTEA